MHVSISNDEVLRYFSGDEDPFVLQLILKRMEDKHSKDHYDPKIERIEDYKERFDFYCITHAVSEDRRKALFLTRIGQTTHAKLKTLVSPQPLSELTLDAIVEKLQPETVEIVECFKFFKRQQDEVKGVADYMAELRKLAKTCNYGPYLNTALRDQLVCRLRDQRIQRELLSTHGLELGPAVDKARAMEARCPRKPTTSAKRWSLTAQPHIS